MPDRFQSRVTTYGKLVLTSPYTTSFGAIRGNALFTPFDNAESGFFVGLTPNYATLDPVGLTALMNGNLYQSYRVFASAVKVKFANQDVNHQFEMAIIPSTVNLSGVTMNTVIPQPNCKMMNFTNAKSNIMKHYCTTAKAFGVPLRSVKDDISGEFNGNLSSGPQSQWAWYIFLQTIDLQNSGASVAIDIEVTYWFEAFNLQKGILTN